MRSKVMLVLLLLLTLVLFGCASEPDAAEPGVQTEGAGAGEAPDNPPSLGMMAAPGMYEEDDGTVQALGILTYRDDEGGYWAVVDTALADEADTAAVIAVIEPDNDISGSMERYQGEYVSIFGNPEDKMHSAGPVMEGRTIEVVKDVEADN